jgi:hypothetical protein
MEQFDTDENLVEKSKNKKNESKTHFLLIGICCIIIIGGIIFLYKYVKSQNNPAIVADSKNYYY